MNIEDNLAIGHVTCADTKSGLTVFLFAQRVACGWWLCGSAPATRDVNLLDTNCAMEHIDALLFTGGSAYGLGAANGVMEWLREQGRGYPTKFGVVPIVPTAAIYDFSAQEMSIPTAGDAYRACTVASKNNTLHGCVGVGTAATVGKWFPEGQPMPGGFGIAELSGKNGLKVVACAAVNSVGNVLDAQGKTLAGARAADGKFVDFIQALATDHLGRTDIGKQNTTLVAVFTNAYFDKAALGRIAKSASAGMARAIMPVFTCYDGDVVFAASLGDLQVDEFVVSALAAEATRAAIVNAVI